MPSAWSSRWWSWVLHEKNRLWFRVCRWKWLSKQQFKVELQSFYPFELKDWCVHCFSLTRCCCRFVTKAIIFGVQQISLTRNLHKSLTGCSDGGNSRKAGAGAASVNWWHLWRIRETSLHTEENVYKMATGTVPFLGCETWPILMMESWHLRVFN